MIPTRERALEILIEGEKLNPGPWKQHCLTVGYCAEQIADKCNLDMDKAYILGLLHDIGRRYGVSHFGHIVDGYKYMMELGYDEVARICLTHSFSTGNINDYIGKVDVSQKDFLEMKEKLEATDFDEYDKLIQLCDCLAGSDGVVNMKVRMDDVERRYGSYPNKKRIENMKLKKYFEELTYENIYKLVSEDESLWRL